MTDVLCILFINESCFNFYIMLDAIVEYQFKMWHGWSSCANDNKQLSIT
jgi:hypothetical protein